MFWWVGLLLHGLPFCGSGFNELDFSRLGLFVLGLGSQHGPLGRVSPFWVGSADAPGGVERVD
jgi:hypothetical protein